VLLWSTPPGFKSKRRKALPPTPPYLLRVCVLGTERREEKSMFAVIKSGGRQYKVSAGQTIEVNRLAVEAGAQVEFDEVLLISDADRSMVGTPVVNNAVVLATATRQARGKKVIVFRYKPKKRQRHRRGHRQELTVLTIDDIVADGISLVTGEPPKARQAPGEEEIVIPEAAVGPEAETEVEVVAPEEETEKKTTRRRRTTRAEDINSESGEDSENKTEE
jgi:large subunit ribosomal protein L21